MISEPTHDNSSYFQICSISLKIEENIDENGISTFFEVATKFFDVYSEITSIDNKRNDSESLVKFIKSTGLDIQVHSLNRNLKLNADNDTCRGYPD